MLYAPSARPRPTARRAFRIQSERTLGISGPAAVFALLRGRPADPAERYPIIDITGKDIQPFLQTLPVLPSDVGQKLPLEMSGRSLATREKGGPFDEGRNVS